MAGVNKVIIIGRLGADPELKTTPSGQSVCVINVATSEAWVKDGKKEERTEWHRITLWARLAELASKYLKKGRQVFIEGRLQTRSWQDPQGQKRYATEIIATNMQFLESASSRSDSDRPFGGDDSFGMQNDPFYSASTGQNQHEPSSHSRSFDEDIPF